MVLLVALTSAEWAVIEAAGSGVLFRPGTLVLSQFARPRHLPPARCPSPGGDCPPAEFVEAAQPCETCRGEGYVVQETGERYSSRWCLCGGGTGPYGERPCSRCGGTGIEQYEQDPRELHPCPDCLNGKRRIAVVVPCDGCGGEGGHNSNPTGWYWIDCHKCDTFGFVTVGHVVVTSGPDLHDDGTYAIGVECTDA